jgi:cytochrome P450
MLFGISCANRDPAYFDQGDAFDLDRICPVPPLMFGNGMHYCVGSHLARSVMATALDAILDRLPELRLEDDPGVQVQGGSLRGPNRLPVTF